MTLAGHGLALELPSGWEGRIRKHGRAEPSLHAASFALPVEDGDFATRAVERMPGDGVLVVLTEYAPDLAGIGLFEARGLPVPLARSSARPETLLRRLPGQSGLQRFFTYRGRAFCLYVVVGSRPTPAALVERANNALRSLSITTTP